MSSPNPLPPSDRTLNAIEETLRALLGDPAPPSTHRSRGRPVILPTMALWAGLLVGVLRGLRHQADVWRLLSKHGLWELPHYPVSDMAVYDRLERTPPTAMAVFFDQITALLQERFETVSTCAWASFAAGIYAIDHTILDPVLRKRKLLRELPPGDRCLLPGALGCVFDVRRQQWVRVDYVPDPQRDLHAEIDPLVKGLPVGSLLLFDLGYFAFWWFDQLMERGYHYVSRLRSNVTYTVAHCFYQGGNAAVQLWDGLVYLGRHQADRAAHPVRLIEVTVRQGSTTRTYRYITNVLDPRQLPAWQVVGLYRKRWDIESGFDLIKTHLGLKLLWSSFPNVVLHQVYATFIIAQIVLALRTEIAQQADVDLREVSLELMVRWLPRLASWGHDPVREFIEKGRAAGYIRPCRTKEWEVPRVAPEDYHPLEEPLPPRAPRYGSRDYNANTYVQDAVRLQKRARYWDFDLCRRTV